MASENPQTAIEVVDAPLLASFTHQIINPLNGVLGTIDNLVDGTIPMHRREQRLRAVRAQLQHTVELVRNLAYLSQLTTEAGRQSLRALRTRCVIPAIVIEAAQFFQELASERGMKISLMDERSQFTVTGPKDLLRQVFTNLFENAIKYGDRDSRIEVSPRRQASTGHLIVDVTNRGPGFKDDERERIFQRGYRGEAAQGMVASGSGLGLYICREILECGFGARIEAEHSRRHRKTTFRLRFEASTMEPLELR